ncbi:MULTISPECIES: flagellar biosynthesis anti-sigma factor FlgM [unclassified Sedimentibacter]|uniref:flagellar biosynthesis anti-sigma factor FlgM n=1 Tax=unclassified Sedimentibacter TaxID=2649220 RepID=UPI0027E023E7|nr:flagellar biosynthesis anti-sigma factor FlgM [Sedimentibacter sp. MB35-C1]WMJ78585.1 flagellar biosynthesis anti-sigma factor FlgM [Sedimentibacter sp. MB35-C1]
MKIQNISNYMNYKASTRTVKNEESVKSKKFDVIEIKSSTDQDELKLTSIKKDVTNKINKETDAEKINRIKESINNRTYSVDVEEIVNKLLK